MSVEVLKQIWPEWQIEGKPLGKGSFGVVYKAVRRDHGVESYAAIKVISIPTDPSEVDSLCSEGLDMNATRTYLQGIVNDFVSEIQLMESLKGVQNIVSVEDYKVVEKTGEIGWDIYIRMELLTSFNAYICDKKLTEEEVIKLGCDICTALEICAKRNIIHRDIKPENIFINDFGYFKLGDFGIARKMENMTGGLSQKGTFNYMAPEVANSSEYDARVDTYSLGIVLYRLLNGNRLPFLDTEKQLLNPNERRNAVDRRLRGEDLPAPCDASPAMADLILRACAYDPNLRFASATEMKQALMSVANGTYQIGASRLDRTTSVRKAADSYDKTTSVRKAPAASNQKSAPAVNTFGSAPKKKSKMPAVIAAVLAVVLLVGAGIFAVPKLLNGNDSTDPDETSGQTTSETADYSKFDEEQIATIISEADALAAEEDYEGALVKVQTGLVTYPKSAELQDKADEYTEALNAQIKAKTLDEAKALADSGDYVSAIALIKNAQETQGDDADYQAALKTYSTAYKTEVIASADGLAANGDYIGALEAVGTASAVIGDDAELSAKAAEYENSYVSGIIQQADECIAVKQFDAAGDILDAAQDVFPNNTALKDAQKKLSDSIERAKNACKYLGKDITAYNNGLYYEEYNGKSSFNLAGVAYKYGFTIGTYEYGGTANFNLGGKYNYFAGVAGNVDGVNYSVTYNVLGDGELIGTIDVQGACLPTPFEFDVSGVKQLSIVATGRDNYAEGVGFGNAVLYNEASDKPILYEFNKLPETAYLGSDIKSYVSGLYYEEYSGMSTFSLAGETYTKGFTIGTYAYGGYASFNIGGNYTTLTGVAGNVDGVNYSVTYTVLGDGEVLGTIDVKGGGLPTEFSFDVTGIMQLNFIATGRDNYAEGVGFGNVVLK